MHQLLDAPAEGGVLLRGPIGPIKIIGIGNPLMGDDGVGIAAVERLASLPLPPGVEAIDGGTGGITLLGLMEGAAVVLLVDAVSAGRPPGTVLRLDPRDLPQGEIRLTVHAGLLEVLALGGEMGILPPRLVVFGVEPASIVPRVGLSPAVERALDPLLEGIFREIPAVSSEAGEEPSSGPRVG